MGGVQYFYASKEDGHVRPGSVQGGLMLTRPGARFVYAMAGGEGCRRRPLPTRTIFPVASLPAPPARPAGGRPFTFIVSLFVYVLSFFAFFSRFSPISPVSLKALCRSRAVLNAATWGVACGHLGCLHVPGGQITANIALWTPLQGVKTKVFEGVRVQ